MVDWKTGRLEFEHSIKETSNRIKYRVPQVQSSDSPQELNNNTKKIAKRVTFRDSVTIRIVDNYIKLIQDFEGSYGFLSTTLAAWPSCNNDFNFNDKHSWSSIKKTKKNPVSDQNDQSGIRTHATEVNAALTRRLRPLGHLTEIL